MADDRLIQRYESNFAAATPQAQRSARVAHYRAFYRAVASSTMVEPDADELERPYPSLGGSRVQIPPPV